MNTILRATGCTLSADDLLKTDSIFSVLDYGAKENGSPVDNTAAINEAIHAAAVNGGGTVVIPAGTYKVYTIHLESLVNLYFEKGATLLAAKTSIQHSYQKQESEGGNYEEPEVNRYAGLQDHGHTYFANSLIYGADIHNVMIYGEGLINGAALDQTTDTLEYVLQGGDPMDPKCRNGRGHNGEWFGNKAIALVRCENIVLKDFSLVIGGHFAIIAEAVTNLLCDSILVDTTRDAFDIDCCEQVTVRNSSFNSLTDDAIVIKSSFGAGFFKPAKNIWIHDCMVSGYDAGSVYAKTYSCDKLIATDRCGPTARIKLGTESSCGYDQITIERTRFDRSRGFALEAVDLSDMTNIIFTDCVMEHISSSPIFIRIGDRGRFPVTGNTEDESLPATAPNVRIDDLNFVLPDTKDYACYPAKRYAPSYNKTKRISVDGHSFFHVVDPDSPTRINPANYKEENGHYYLMRYDRNFHSYVPDYSFEISKDDRCRYANALGSFAFPEASHIEISNLTVTDADPRYPMLIMGLMDSPVMDVVLKNISVTYRGGLTMEHAVEQRQLNTNWKYTQYKTLPSVQTLPWLVNPFFLKEEGLLPRMDWNPDTKSWEADPYNVPELPRVYPEPSNWGILPAYGLYIRHAKNITVENMDIHYEIQDERHPVVLDDVSDISFTEFSCDCAPGTVPFACITNPYKRHTNYEYLKDEPYSVTTVTNLSIPSGMEAKTYTVSAPAPGTPSDSLYAYSTLAIPENGYEYATDTKDYPLPLTVFRPFFQKIGTIYGKTGTMLSFFVFLRDPASEATNEQAEGKIYNEILENPYYVVEGMKRNIS
ncbi:MAG: hypothetical protein E7256_16705, partial [Lachnospiraceae bacterium]|nr:hypothetical protein [Lachnospiraceae bacterium]